MWQGFIKNFEITEVSESKMIDDIDVLKITEIKTKNNNNDNLVA